MPLYVVYLDQNKWVELTRAALYPEKYSAHQAIVRRLSTAVDAGRLVIPLSATNIYETSKINDRERRVNLAAAQAMFSHGYVLRGRYKRLEVEICNFLTSCGELPIKESHEDWFLSRVFFEAVLECSDSRLGVPVEAKVIEFIERNAAECMFSYLVDIPDEIRIPAVRKFSAGSEGLRILIEERRRRHANESRSMRRKIYSAILFINESELIFKIINSAGSAWKSVEDIGASKTRRLINDVPTYYIEREIALRLEEQSRPIEENDFRDMQAFCAAIPYADIVVGENQFVNLARQAGLDTKYNTCITTDLFALEKCLDQLDKL